MLNQLDISRNLNVEKSYVIFSESNDNMTSCKWSSVIFPKWGLWCAISIFRSSGAMILNSAEKFFCSRHVQRTAASRYIWKLPILAGWHVLRKLRHMKKVPCKKFITIRKQLVYALKWPWNQQLSATVSEVQQRITKHMVFYDDRRYKARDICFFDFNWSRKLSSNSIGPENLRSQNRNSRVDTTAR